MGNKDPNHNARVFMDYLRKEGILRPKLIQSGRVASENPARSNTPKVGNYVLANPGRLRIQPGITKKHEG